MAKLNLILAIHNHQPVGNFDSVLEAAYKNAYLPFIETFSRHSKLKAVLHYSGNLLIWMQEKHPEAFEIIKNLISDGRVEMLSGAFYDPILPVIPENDRVMQIQEMTGYIKKTFSYQPHGMWLPERVWEPHLPISLTQAGIEYLPIDDYLFMLTGMAEEELYGYYITEEAGHSVKLFPGSEKLRYAVPFHDVEAVFEYFRKVSASREQTLLTFADDGEKFGMWPHTHRHCYENGWLERFFTALEENADWIETTTFSEFSGIYNPLGKAYLPSASYREMGEWSLPSERALEYPKILSDMQRLFGEKAAGLLRGGIWRTFFAKYPESNHIHKRMLMISRKVHDAVKNTKGSSLVNSEVLLHELWKGQCNDAYWHGIFGGLYLPHLRSSLYRHLITAETMAEQALAQASSVIEDRVFVQKGDIDCDGHEDICISSNNTTAFFSEKGGALIELSVKDRGVNVLDTLTRKIEPYHSKISGAALDTSGNAQTIHERLLVKEEGLADYLVYDRRRRASLLDHFFSDDVTLESLMQSTYNENFDFTAQRYEIKHINGKNSNGCKLSSNGFASKQDIRLEKTVLFTKSGIRVDYLLEGKYNDIFACEFNLSFSGSPSLSVRTGGKVFPINEKGIEKDMLEFSVSAEFLGLDMKFSFDEPVELWHYPVETVSLSEQGVERIYQGTAFFFLNRADSNNKKKIGFLIDFGG